MGGKSSSSSSSNQTQETTQLTSDGVIAGDLFQGKSITIDQDFPDSVASAFEQLIGLAGDTVSLAGQAGARALDASDAAIEKVSDRSSFAQEPELQTFERYIPVAMLAIAAVGVYFVTRKG